MADSNVEQIFSLVDSALQTYVFDIYSSISSGLQTPFLLAATVWIIIYGILIIRQVTTPSIPDLLTMAWKFIFAYTVVFSWAIVNQFLVSLVTDAPAALAGYITGGTGSIYAQIGQTAENLSIAAARAFESDGYIRSFFIGAAIWLAGILQIAYAMFLIILSKIVLAVLLAITPIFGIFYLFKGTSKMMEAWLQQIINFSLVSVLAIATLAFTNTLLDKTLAVIPATPDDIHLGNILAVVLVSIVTFLVLMQIKSLASAIAGGVQLSTFSAYGQAAMKTYAGGKAGAKRAGKAISNTSKAVYSRLSNRLTVKRS